jgi:hypothetical protein
VSKPFEIAYPPDDVQSGWNYAGLNSRTPPIFLNQLEAAKMSNVWLRNQEIRSMHPFSLLFPGPDPNSPTLGDLSFQDGNGVIHTCSFTKSGLYQLNPFNNVQTQNPWTFVGGPVLFQGVPVASRSFANVLYYTNGVPYVLSWDGITNGGPQISSALSSATFGGAGSSMGGQFLYEINNQICILSVSFFNLAQITNPIPGTGPTTLPAGATTQFPQLLWWSANGIPNQFDPTVNTSAGFNNFLDVPDTFTGVMAFGEVAYLFRKNGITYQTIGGNNNLVPFYFDHLWSSEVGIGNVYPWSIGQYGGVGFCVATDNVYKASVQGFAPIGAGSRDQIMRDLMNSTSTPVASVIPGFSQGYIYLRYELCVPLGTFTRIYSFSLEDSSWIQQDLQNVIVSGRPTLCWR